LAHSPPPDNQLAGEGSKAVAEALKANKSLQYLNLKSKFELLLFHFSKEVHVLTLSAIDCEIGLEAARIVADALKTSTCALHHLNLSSKHILFFFFVNNARLDPPFFFFSPKHRQPHPRRGSKDHCRGTQGKLIS
jgi:hypothetical protein